jgi:hypothetical protein
MGANRPRVARGCIAHFKDSSSTCNAFSFSVFFFSFHSRFLIQHLAHIHLFKQLGGTLRLRFLVASSSSHPPSSVSFPTVHLCCIDGPWPQPRAPGAPGALQRAPYRPPRAVPGFLQGARLHRRDWGTGGEVIANKRCMHAMEAWP